MIRVYARKAFAFKNYIKQGNATVPETKAGKPIEAKTRPSEFADLPDWVVNDPIFEWAKQDEDIQVMENVKQEKQTEKKVADEGSKANEANEADKPVSDNPKDDSKDNSKKK